MTNAPNRRVEQGPTGLTVRRNVARLRASNGYTLRDMATAMHAVGRPMSHVTLNGIENGGRRVDVDDLTALAAALNVSPAALLLPHITDQATLTAGITGLTPTTYADAWDWITAAPPTTNQKGENDG